MKKMLAVKLVVILLVFAGLIVMNGCSAGTNKASVSATNSEPFTIKVVSPEQISGPVVYWVAEELGFTKEENLKLEEIGIVPQGSLVASVVAGKLDVAGGTHVNRTIAGIAAGAKIKAVVASSESTKEVPHRYYVTLKNSPINSAQDLVGKKMGLTKLGGCHEYIPYAWLEKNGIKDSNKGKLNFAPVPSNAKMVQALRQGEVDIGCLGNDSALIAKNWPDLKIVFSDYDIWETLGGATPYYFSEKFIKENPDVVRRFVKVIAKTHNWLNNPENKQRAKEITAQRANVAVNTLTDGSYYAPDGIIKPETIQVWIDLLERFGEIAPGLKPANIYTNEFNELATGKS